MQHSGLVAYHDDLTQLLAPIDNVQPHPDNANNGDIEAITASIETSGMYRPIYAQKSTNYILSGNHTWYACKQLDAQEIPIVWLDVDDITAKRIMVADNRIAALAVPDPALLLALLNDLADDGSLTGTGFADHDLEAMRMLADMGYEGDDFAQWPVITIRVPPHVRRAYLNMTHPAVDDRERFELLLRMAGWDGKDETDVP